MAQVEENLLSFDLKCESEFERRHIGFKSERSLTKLRRDVEGEGIKSWL